MSLRQRSGNWHYRFYAAGKRWTADTGLVATERNRNGALIMEMKARKLVGDGQADQLKILVKPFSDAADQFIEFAKGEHRSKPQTWKRLRGSMTSLKMFFKQRPLHTINVGLVKDYMSWRRICPACRGEGCDLCNRSGQGIQEITLRHDLHALSPLFQYGIDQNWCTVNAVEKVTIPSDADAVRIHVLTPAEEMLYFATCQRLAFENLHDLGRLMLLQGPRPSEVLSTCAAHINGLQWEIPSGKSKAARRVLHLTPESKGILEKRLMAAGLDGFLFPSRALSSIENSHKRVLEACGLHFVIYDFRHTFATRFAEATNGDVVALASILGHGNLRTVMRYVHVSQEHCRNQMNKFMVAEEIRGQSGANTSAEIGKPEQTSANQTLALKPTVN